MWDIGTKDKIRTMMFNRNPIISAKVSPDGHYLAYALGNDWHMGHEGIGKWNNKLCVHELTKEDVKNSN